jgi:hypothetical protein
MRDKFFSSMDLSRVLPLRPIGVIPLVSDNDNGFLLDVQNINDFN